MDLESDAYKQKEVAVSDFLLPQEYKMEYVKYCTMVNPMVDPCYIRNNKCIAN